MSGGWPGLGPLDRRRETCLWLSVRSALQAGAVARVVRRFGSLDAALDAPLARLVEAVDRGRTRSASGDGPGDGGREKERIGPGDRAWRDLCAMPPDAHPEPAAAGSGPGAREEVTAAAADRAIVTWCDRAYPQRLRRAYDPPPALFLRGARWRWALAELESSPAVAVVGARGPSAYGLEMTAGLAGDLARNGVSIVSGLALGIDAAAHRAALAARREVAGGVCAAVLGCGADVVHPRSNARLFAAVAAEGVLISEAAWTLTARAWRFPARNRIIAGLADAVVVVEGRANSGALYTAGFALDMGREVLAVPGEAGRRLSAGPHRLLRDGAHLCEAAEDVLCVIGVGLRDTRAGMPEDRAASAPSGRAGGDLAARPPEAGSSGGATAARVLAALELAPASVDQLVSRLHLEAAAVAAALAALEVDELVTLEPGGRFRVRRVSAAAASHSRRPYRRRAAGKESFPPSPK